MNEYLSELLHSRARMAYPDERRRTLRFPGRLYKQLQEAAKRDHRRVNAEIVWLLLVAIEWRNALLTANERFGELGPSDEDEPEPDQGGSVGADQTN